VFFDLLHILARGLTRGLVVLLFVAFVVMPGLIASQVDLDADDPDRANELSDEL
jgi:hypothetical protein